MSLVTLTAVLGVLATVIGGVTVPVLMSRKADKEKTESTENVTFEKLNRALDRQNERLEERIALLEDQHAKEVAQLKAKYDTDLAALKNKYDTDLEQANRRIRELEAEQLRLLRRITSLDDNGQ